MYVMICACVQLGVRILSTSIIMFHFNHGSHMKSLDASNKRYPVYFINEVTQDQNYHYPMGYAESVNLKRRIRLLPIGSLTDHVKHALHTRQSLESM